MSAMSSIVEELEDFVEIPGEGRKEDTVDHSTELRLLEHAWLGLSSPLDGEEDIWNDLIELKYRHNMSGADNILNNCQVLSRYWEV